MVDEIDRRPPGGRRWWRRPGEMRRVTTEGVGDELAEVVGERLDRRGRLVLVVAALVVVAAEALTLTGNLGGASVGHSLAIVLLITVAIVDPSRPVRRLSIAILPISVLRLVSMAVPVPLIPTLAWYVEIGVPVYLAVGLAARALGLRPTDLGLRRMPLRDAVAMTFAGGAVGLPAYLIGLPDPLLDGPALSGMLGASLILIVFVAALEEILLRGLIQSVATESFPRGGLFVSAAATMLVYAATLNLRYIVFMTLVAVLLGASVGRYRSLAGAIGAHGAFICVQLVICPIVLR